MGIDQDVVGKLAEDVELVFRPGNLEPALKILGGILGSKPALCQFVPLCLLPDRLIGNAIDAQLMSRLGRTIFAAVVVVRRGRTRLRVLLQTRP